MLTRVTKDDLVAAFRGGAQLTADLPVTGPLIQRVADRLGAAEAPALWKALEGRWLRRHWSSPRDAWLLLLAALHYEALRKPGHPLARFFPTCRGQAGDLRAAVDAQLDAPSEELVRNLLERTRVSYWDYWASLWVNPAAFFFQRRGLPYLIAEAGTIGGLHACADLLAPQPAFDSSLVTARVGFDAQPLHLESLNDRHWLLASALPDNLEQFNGIQAAIGRYRALIRDGVPPVQLVPCEPSLSARAISKNVRPEEGLGLLVLTTWATQRMTPAEFAGFRSDMVSLMAEWEQRALWLELTATPEGRPTIDFQLAAHRWITGKLQRHVVASIELGSSPKLLADEGTNQAFFA